MTWYNENFSTAEEDLKKRKDQQLKNSARRFFLRADTATDIVFLDDRAFTFDEHKIWTGGQPLHFTCLGVKGGCPGCLDGYSKERVTMFTIIDTSRWEDKKKNVHENEKKILAIGPEAANAMREKKNSWGGLVGKAVKVRRVGTKSPSYGTEFEPLMRDGKMITVDIKTRYKDHAPFDYAAIFTPQNREDLVVLMAKAKRDDNQSTPIALGETADSFGGPAIGGSDAPAGEVEDNSGVPF